MAFGMVVAESLGGAGFGRPTWRGALPLGCVPAVLMPTGVHAPYCARAVFSGELMGR